MKRLIDILGIALYSCGIDPDKPHSLVFSVSIAFIYSCGIDPDKPHSLVFAVSITFI